IYTGAKQWEWEEEAYLQGATHVLTKPVRIRMLTAVLDRLSETPGAPVVHSAPAQIAAPDSYKAVGPTQSPSHQTPVQRLSHVRGFSAILTHSLDADAMLKQFLLLLRELIGINRAAVFLRQPSEWVGEQLALDDNRRLRAACAIGLSAGLLEHFELS